MVPTPRAIVLGCCGLVAALLPVVADPLAASGAGLGWLGWLWPLYLCLFCLALGVDAILAPRARHLTAHFAMPDTIWIGAPAEAQLTLTVTGAGARAGAGGGAAARQVPVAIAFDVSGMLEPPPPLRGVVAPQGSAFRLPLVPTRRGRFAVECAWVRLAGPLGLVERTLRRPLARQAAVVQQPPPIRGDALRLAAGARDLQAGLKIERYQGDGTEFDSLKEFVKGDDPRTIDWKASAHHRQLIARQHRAERNHQIVLVVDTGRLMCEPLAGIPKVDQAVTAALLIAYISARAGDRIALATFGAGLGLWMKPRGGMAAYHEMALQASHIDYSDAETNFTLGLTALYQHLNRRSLAIVLTDFVDTVTAELMLENLGRLARRHVVVFVALQDPHLAATAARQPADLRQLDRAVIAATLLRDRELVMRRLRRRGIVAIDAVPPELHTSLINTYLDIKRRERI